MQTKLQIQNLKCGGCANTIINKLNAIDEVSGATVDHETDEVSFDHSDDQARVKAIVLLSKLGYPVAGDENSILKVAKSYVSCAKGRMA